MPHVCTPRLGTIQSASPGLRPLRERSPTALVARVEATATLSATVAPVSRFVAVSAIVSFVVNCRRYLLFSISGKSTVTNLIAAGPIVTTQMAGKIQNTSGNTIFTPVLAAASSARWRRLVRSVSE